MARRTTRRATRRPAVKAAAPAQPQAAMPVEAKQLWAALSQDMVTFPGNYMRKCMSTAHHVIQCHTLSEVADVQVRCLQDLLQECLNESTRLGDMWMQAMVKSCSAMQQSWPGQTQGKAAGG